MLVHSGIVSNVLLWQRIAVSSATPIGCYMSEPDDPSITHVTRQFLGRQAQHVRFVPFAEAGPAPSAPPGTMLAHRLYVTAGWQQEIRASPPLVAEQTYQAADLQRLSPVRVRWLRAARIAEKRRQHSRYGSHLCSNSRPSARS